MRQLIGEGRVKVRMRAKASVIRLSKAILERSRVAICHISAEFLHFGCPIMWVASPKSDAQLKNLIRDSSKLSNVSSHPLNLENVILNVRPPRGN